MWISFTKISSFKVEEHFGSNCGMIKEVLKMITEGIILKTLYTPHIAVHFLYLTQC